MRRQGSAPKLDNESQQGATGMEHFAVTRIGEGLWSVSQDGETFATHLTGEEALSFARAAERRRAGIDVIVVITQARH